MEKVGGFDSGLRSGIRALVNKRKVLVTTRKKPRMRHGHGAHLQSLKERM